jgi:hypothetical protein
MKVANGPYVRVHGISNEILHAEPIIIEVYRKYGRYVSWTSCIDREHSRGSLHYTGDAIDVWWNDDDWTEEEGRVVAHEIQANLGQDYDVVKREGKYHIHVEYQPKTGVNQ